MVLLMMMTMMLILVIDLVEIEYVIQYHHCYYDHQLRYVIGIDHMYYYLYYEDSYYYDYSHY